MNIAKQLLTTARRNFSARSPNSSRFRKLKAAQKKFQIDDGTPIFLKGGLFDRLLYNATLFSCIFGVGWSMETAVQLVLK